jgi:hypothetical protein
MLTEPVMTPAASFTVSKRAFEEIENRTVRDLLFRNFSSITRLEYTRGVA